MTHKNLIKIYFFFILVFCIEANSKTYEKKNFICADEVGPVIEFHLPNFDNGQVEKELFFKLFYSGDRKLFYDESGTMLKQTSPIDNSYFYYKVDTILKSDESTNFIFEFFPPSTLMLKKGKYMFKTLACWND